MSGQAGTAGDGKNPEAWDRDYSQRSEETCDAAHERHPVGG